jgi:hypothetical protein
MPISFPRPLLRSPLQLLVRADVGVVAVAVLARGTKAANSCVEGGDELAHYLVVHTPSERDVESVRSPTRLRELAEASIRNDQSPRWLKTWSPDLHDDRIFTLWEGDNADEVRTALAEFGFLDDMDATPLRVREWGPDDVLAAPE